MILERTKFLKLEIGIEIEREIEMKDEELKEEKYLFSKYLIPQQQNLIIRSLG